MRAEAVVAVLALACGVVAEQMPLSAPTAELKKRKLKGRFLHITDFHPDTHYKTGATFDSGCHRLPGEKAKSSHGSGGKGKSKSRLEDFDGQLNATDKDDDDDEDVAGKWGNILADCDSPMTLVDLTFEWLKKEWVDEIDFVVWTGDSARHDIDRDIPRTPKEIFSSNRMMAQKMIDVFGKNFPIVPTLGNNDIWPHNIIQPGPNRITEEFLKIWKHWIPEDDRHVFERGAYFAVEVIPDQLAVISLNTLFWFQSNSAVDGCKDRSNDPGALEMDWLEVQLNLFRDRGMQVWLIGHVPPHQGVFYDNCYLRYGDLALRFQDTIVGHLFGHQNVDHFFFLDVPELNDAFAPSKKDFDIMEIPDAMLNGSSVEDFTFIGPELRHGGHNLNSGRLKVLGRGSSKKAESMKKDLQDSWDLLPPVTDLKYKDYAVMNVGPSVIPTYIPSARIFSYNITGVTLEADSQVMFINLPPDEEDEEDLAEIEITKKDCKKPENEDKPRCAFKNKPRYSSPESPSRSNKPLSALGYTQFFLPTIEKQNKQPAYQIEYSTFKPKSLLPEALSGVPLTQPPPVPYHLLPGYDPSIERLSPEDLSSLDDDESADSLVKGKKGKKGDPKAKFLKEIKRITPWKMNDLTIKSYVKFARTLMEDKKKWKKFVHFMFVSSGEGDE